jgi:signal transduction histidine kinase
LGLGLYISRCIIEAHGGRILAQSQPGAGTEVSLTLPVHVPAAAVASGLA